MNFYDFIKADELSELPDDPSRAFCTFVRLASDRLRDEVQRLDDNSQDSWQLINEARHGFVNVVVAVAKQLGIEPFATLSVPRFDRNHPYDYEQFRFDLDHFITQVEMSGLLRGRRESVDLPIESRDRIRAHLSALKSCVEKSTMSPAKKEALLRRLDSFEAELNKRRVNLLEVSLVAFAILGSPGSVWASYDIIAKLTSNIMGEVAIAKQEEEEARAVSAPPPVPALSPPRKEIADDRPRGGRSANRSGYGGGRPVADLDDEIPF